MDNEYIYLEREFLKDLKTQKLSINTVTYPVATIKRMFKYQQKGYNINDACVEFVRHVSMTQFDEEKMRLYID